MNRERALKVVLVLVGLLFSAGIYPVVTSVRSGWEANKEDALPMMLSLYVTLGIFLLLAARNPSANRSVIAFAAWSLVAPLRTDGLPFSATALPASAAAPVPESLAALLPGFPWANRSTRRMECHYIIKYSIESMRTPGR